MQAQNSSKPKVRKRTGKKILKWLLAIVVVLIVLAIFLVPVYVSSEGGHRLILAKINSSIAGRTDFADLSMGWWKGIKVTDLSFDDNAGQVSVRVKQIATKPHYGAILMGNLSFGQTMIDRPNISLNLKNKPAIELERVGEPQTVPVKTKHINLAMDVDINDGRLKVTDSKNRTVEFSQINSKVNLRPPGQPTDFNINMAVVDKAGQSEIHTAGTITPQSKTGWTLAGTTGDLTVEVNDLNLQSLAPVFALAELETQAKGIISANVKSEIKDGRFENLTGVVKAKNLDIISPQLKGDRLQTKTLDVAVNLSATIEAINIDRLQLKTDWADLTASGTVPTTLKSLSDFLQPDSSYNLKGSFDCNLPALLSQMPKTLGLKEGTKISSGKLTGNVETLAQAGQKHIRANASLAGLEGTVEGKKIALSQPLNAEAIISSDKAGIKFDKLGVSAPFATVTCTGSTQLLKFDSDIDLAKLQSELGQFANLGKYQMAGQLLSTGQVSLKDNIITAAGSSTAKNLRISSKEPAAVPAPALDGDVTFAFDIDRGNDIVTIASLKAVTSLGQVSIKDAVLPFGNKPAKPLHLVVAASNLDLQKLQPFAALFVSLPKQMQFAGVVDSSISLIAEKDIYALTTDSTKIKNLKIASQGQPPFEQSEVSLVLDVRVDPKQKTVNLRKLQLTSPQVKIYKAEFSETAKADKTLLQGRIDCEYDWSAVGPYLPQGIIVKGVNKLPIEFSSEYPAGQRQKLLDNLSTKGTLGFTQAQYLGLVFERTEAQIQIQNGSFTILPLSTKVNNGEFHFAGQGNLKQDSRVLRTPQPMQIMKDIQINDEMARKLLMYVNPIFADAINVSGIANFSCELLAIPLAKEKQNEIEIIGTVSVNKLRLQTSDILRLIFSLTGTGFSGVDITVRPTKFVLRNGLLSYDDMQVEVGDSPINFKGAIGLLDKSLNMTVILPYTMEGKTARIGRETIGQRISLPLKGTLDKPELDMGKLLEEQLKQKLLEGLDKLLR
ncbi:MAG: hypothetical protein NTX52_03180 [Planctomycetota bacterium]|nr:hypothetical protein [Planctomycetota bacterium]